MCVWSERSRKNWEKQSRICNEVKSVKNIFFEIFVKRAHPACSKWSPNSPYTIGIHLEKNRKFYQLFSTFWSLELHNKNILRSEKYRVILTISVHLVMSHERVKSVEKNFFKIFAQWVPSSLLQIFPICPYTNEFHFWKRNNLGPGNLLNLFQMNGALARCFSKTHASRELGTATAI